MSQQKAAVALVKGFGVAFEDVEEFLDDGLVDGVVVPDIDSAILHISADGDAIVCKRVRFLLFSHEIGSFSFWGDIPAQR